MEKLLIHKKRIYVFLAILIVACNGSQKNKQGETIAKSNDGNTPLFTIRSAEETNIHFKNSLTENRALNGILYEYLYNGGGVAVADFNGDELMDIYFVSNLESNKLYLNKRHLKFEDITSTSKVQGGKGFPTGVTVVDINSDGKQDIYICKSGNYRNPDDRRNELYINMGNDKDGIPIFKENAKAFGLDLPNYSTQATFFDYDKDGDLDMFLINHGTRPYEDGVMPELMATKAPLQSSGLFKNENGFYKDVSEESNIINNAISFGLGVAIGDLNNDTWPDILVGNDFSEKDHLYLNQQNGTFKEVIKEATNHISYFSMGNDISDFNNDGWLDFVSLDMMSEHNYDIKTSMSGMNPARFYDLEERGLHYQYMYNTMQLNNGIANTNDQIPLFSDVAQMNGVSSTDWSWGPLVLDMDNDGWKDLFVSNGIKRDFRNNDFIKYKKSKFDEFFSTHGEKTKENQELARDLTLELINEMPVRNKPNYFFQNKNGEGFVKKNGEWATDYPTSSNGAAYADLDNDGDLDIVVNNTDDFAMIYENNSRTLNSNNYVQIKLKGSKNNPNGLGARIILEDKGKTQIQENYFTRGFQSAASAHLHFGIGTEESIEKVTVIWTDNKTDVYKNMKANQIVTLDYNDAKTTYVASKNTEHLFKDITQSSQLIYQHSENDFDDFERESLLPHRMSHFGPALATHDVNGDGLGDVYVGGAKGSSGKLFVQSINGNFQEKVIPVFKNDKAYEDVGALFFDADGDGDADLYVVSGGNEYDEGSKLLNDRL
ncbi:MAG: CRTAC1 family protein [Flavobacteriales bacterium]